MKPDFDQLRKDAFQLTEAEGRNEVIADLNRLEESEAKFELLQNGIKGDATHLLRTLQLFRSPFRKPTVTKSPS